MACGMTVAPMMPTANVMASASASRGTTEPMRKAGQSGGAMIISMA